MSLHFAKPSLQRVIWSMIAVAVASCVVAGLAASIGLIVTARDTPPDCGEYVRLVVMCLTFWGPILLLTIWFITIPVIIALGALVASIRRREAAANSEQTPLER
ncbi:hypothetical protein [[Mycobacterium] vasticus]|uniref:Transmembrane protein n=1 Tax=[Mycobacterium] vasticus TaxID=2875777 RepID=A0ABU5YZ07_9MYCO|nr:hypothetical protein [Mycolicibacter sp. MYC017]MEB3070374.1 hypothetical protein [Mycolicibacter sp. MYC017]